MSWRVTLLFIKIFVLRLVLMGKLEIKQADDIQASLPLAFSNKLETQLKVD